LELLVGSTRQGAAVVIDEIRAET